MTYLELLNSFWDSTRFDPISSNEATLYLYLLHQCNIRRWINPFEFKTRNLEIMLGLSRKGIASIRNRLKQRGLIDFAEGRGSAPAAYLIKGAKINDENNLLKRFDVSPGNDQGNDKGNNKGNDKGNNKGNTNADHTSLIQDIRLKTKDNRESSSCACEKIHEIVKGLPGEKGWVEPVCMVHKITPAEVPDFLAEFANFVISIGEEATIVKIQDFKRRFGYWLYDAIKRRKNEQDSKSRGCYPPRNARKGNEDPGYGLVD